MNEKPVLVPRDILRALLRAEVRGGGAYSEPAVRASLCLDHTGPGLRSQREYARLWGWSYKRVRHHWKDLKAEVERLAGTVPERRNRPVTDGGSQQLPSGEHREATNGGAEAHEGRTRGAGRGALNTDSEQSGPVRGAARVTPGAHEGRTGPASSRAGAHAPAVVVPGGIGSPYKPSSAPIPPLKAPPSLTLPDWLGADEWAEWVQHRREIGKSLKPTSIRHQLAQLTTWHDAGHDAHAILATSIRNGWAGLFEPDPPAHKAGRLPAGGTPGVSAERATASERRGAYGLDDAMQDVAASRALRLRGTGPHNPGDC